MNAPKKYPLSRIAQIYLQAEKDGNMPPRSGKTQSLAEIFKQKNPGVK